MSLFKKIGSVFKKALPYASFIPGPVGVAASAINMARTAYKAAQPVMSAAPPIMSAGVSNMSLGPLIGAGGRIIGGASRRVGNIARRFPGTTGTVGGIAGGALGGMIGGGGAPRKRRAKGLSGRDLQGFKRTVKLVKQYCKASRTVRDKPKCKR